jgi:hypothetical protein
MSRRTQAIALGLITVLWGLTFPLIAMVGLTSVMISDAGSNDAVMAMIYIALAWPPVTLLAGGDRHGLCGAEPALSDASRMKPITAATNSGASGLAASA